MNPLTAGPGPTYVASMAPDFSASMAAGPALNVETVSLVAPRCLAKKPSLSATIAVAWVRLGKYPRRTSSGATPAARESLPQADMPRVATTALIARATRAGVRAMRSSFQETRVLDAGYRERPPGRWPAPNRRRPIPT